MSRLQRWLGSRTISISITGSGAIDVAARCAELVQALRHHTTLERLTLSSPSLQDAAFADLIPLLRSCDHLQFLNLSSCTLTGVSLPLVAELLRLRCDSTLQYFHLHLNWLGTSTSVDHVAELVRAIEGTRTLRVLILQHNGYREPFHSMLANLVKPKGLNLVMAARGD